jgi:hypothetical protein
MRKIIIEQFECENCTTINEFEHMIKKCRFCGTEVCEDGCGNPAIRNGIPTFKLLHCENPKCVEKALKDFS